VQDEADGRSLLDEIAREGARRMLLAALETEVAAYLETHREERDDDGHALVVRNRKGRARKVTVGAGTIPLLSAPRVNDRRIDTYGQRRRFTSRILPPVHAPLPEGGRGLARVCRADRGPQPQTLACLTDADCTAPATCQPPLGGAVVSSVAVDATRGALYVSTGDCVGFGAAGFANSLLALDTATGALM
jgi:hypothetical protein